MHYTIESLIVGLIVVIVGFPISYALMYWNNKDFKFDFKLSFTLNLFLIGVFVHIISEFIGLNKKYCTDGYACTI
jgi:hypothetical protein